MEDAINGKEEAYSGRDCCEAAYRTHGKAIRMLCINDEFTRESVAIRVKRKLKAADVIEALCELFVSRGIPAHIRSDNGPEFVAEALRDWNAAVGAKTAYIEPGSPWENSYCESFWRWRLISQR